MLIPLFDYLLKPFSKDRFEKAISKFKENSSGRLKQSGSTNKTLIVDYPSEQASRIVVKSGNEIKIIQADDVLYIEAYDDYIKVNVSNDCYLKKYTMQKMEAALDPLKFIRVHRSFIVNTEHITKLEAAGKDSYMAVLRDKTRIPLSKTGYPKLKSKLGI